MLVVTGSWFGVSWYWPVQFVYLSVFQNVSHDKKKFDGCFSEIPEKIMLFPMIRQTIPTSCKEESGSPSRIGRHFPERLYACFY